MEALPEDIQILIWRKVYDGCLHEIKAKQCDMIFKLKNRLVRDARQAETEYSCLSKRLIASLNRGHRVSWEDYLKEHREVYALLNRYSEIRVDALVVQADEAITYFDEIRLL
jgi:hypothetical protein